MGFVSKSKLPRLGREHYRGRAMVFWTHTFVSRATGWLDPAFHGHFQRVLLHTCARYKLACPVYVLMPDHWHLIWAGLSDEADQWVASAFLRKHVRDVLTPGIQLQDRAHDHVLRPDERSRSALVQTCRYVRENPVRAGLVQTADVWPYAGTVFAGYPDLDLREERGWEMFWKAYYRVAGEVL
jgi:putative transposase